MKWLKVLFLLTISFSCCFRASAEDVTSAALAARARQARQAGDYHAAAELYTKLVPLSPDPAEVLSNAGLMRYLAGEDETALECFSKALRKNPKLVPANLFSGLTLLRMARPREALTYLERARGLDDSVLANVGLARAQVMLRHFRAANEYYYIAVRKDPSHAESWFGLGVTYRNLLNDIAERIGRLAPGSPDVKVRLSDIGPPPDRAVMLKRERQAADRHDLQAAVRLAQAYQSLALDALGRAVRLDPNSPRAHLALAEAQSENQNLAAAVPEYEAVVRAMPQSAVGYLGLATAYWRAGHTDRARPPLERALRLAPDDPEANGIMADILVRAGEFDQAAAYAVRALHGNPNLALAHSARAKILLAQHRPAEAAAELRQTLDADSDGTYHYVLYRALKELGRSSEAAQALRTYRARHAVFYGDSADPAH